MHDHPRPAGAPIVRRSSAAPITACFLLTLLASGCTTLAPGAGGRTADYQQYLTQAAEAAAQGDKERALAEFARAIEVNPNLTTAHLGMGDIYRTDGDYAKAETAYARAARVEPRNFDAQYYHGLMLQLLDRVTEAIQAYLRALSIRPDDFQANLNLATAYYQLDENPQALQYGLRAVRSDPASGPARFNLGAIYAALGRHREAVAEFQQATELMPLSPDLLMNLSESYGRLDRFEEMRNTLRRAVEAAPSAAAWERLGYAEFKLRRYDEAFAHFEAALAIDPDYFPALNGVGVSMLNRWIWSDKQDAAARTRGVAALRRSIQLNRDQPRILELLTRHGV